MAVGLFYKDISVLKKAIKFLIQYFPNNNNLKIWDAGCGLGAEPLSISILLNNKQHKKYINSFKIIASDIDECNLIEKLLNEAIVHKSDIRKIPKSTIKKYFISYYNQDYYLISQEIKDKITFFQHNLISLLPLDFDFNMIICKNVLNHIKKKYWIRIFKMFHSVLVNNGILVLNNEHQLPSEIYDYFKKISKKESIFLKKNY